MDIYITKSVTDSINRLHATLEMENTPQAFIEFHFDSEYLQGLTTNSLTSLRKEIIKKYDIKKPEIKMVHVFQSENDPYHTKRVFNALNKVCDCNFEVDYEGNIFQEEEIATAIFN